MVEDFSGYNANIYEENGILVHTVAIVYHDRDGYTIEVSGLPEEAIGKSYDVVVLKAPTPYAYKGVVRRHGAVKIITLYKGRNTEQRAGVRYKTDLPGVIEFLVFDGKEYPLHTPMSVRVINLSKRGLRLRAVPATLVIGTRMRLRVTTEKFDRVLEAEVVNSSSVHSDYTEYGCRLIGQDGINV